MSYRMLAAATALSLSMAGTAFAGESKKALTDNEMDGVTAGLGIFIGLGNQSLFAARNDSVFGNVRPTLVRCIGTCGLGIEISQGKQILLSTFPPAPSIPATN